MPTPRQVHGASTRILSAAMLVIGVALVVVTLVLGGGLGAQGLLVGVLFFAAGAGRLYVERRRS